LLHIIALVRCGLLHGVLLAGDECQPRDTQGGVASTLYRSSFTHSPVCTLWRSVPRQAEPFRIKLQHKIGKPVSVLATVSRQHDEQTGREAILVVAQHIENSAAETDAEEKAALETQMADLRALIDKANVPIWAVDLQGNINEWNYKIASLTQYSKVS
jgi:PAS domain-containing protein